MDKYTREQLKHDKFVDATEGGISWAEHNRSQFIGLAVGIVVLIAAVIGGASYWSHRSEQAQNAFGAAMTTYNAPVRPAGVPADPTQETYGSSQERSKAAYAAFEGVADKYSMTTAGHSARYFAGVVAADQGQFGTAEDQLKKAADSGSADLRSLAKMALASVYQASNQSALAIQSYQDVIAHPTNSVTANAARLQLAGLYESQKNTTEARKIWAQVKDSDKGANGQAGYAGQLAEQKLNGQS